MVNLCLTFCALPPLITDIFTSISISYLSNGLLFRGLCIVSPPSFPRHLFFIKSEEKYGFFQTSASVSALRASKGLLQHHSSRWLASVMNKTLPRKAHHAAAHLQERAEIYFLWLLINTAALFLLWS